MEAGANTSENSGARPSDGDPLEGILPLPLGRLCAHTLKIRGEEHYHSSTYPPNMDESLCEGNHTGSAKPGRLGPRVSTHR